MANIDVGERITPHDLKTITGTEVSVPASERMVHLQFRRFAGCPICRLHLHSIARRHQDIADAGIDEVVVFHSTADTLRRYQGDLPFPIVADPERKLYTEFGVESSPAAIANPRAWLAAARGAARQRSLSAALGRGEDHFGRPADFLIASDGRVLARKYGAHADDQWPVDEILTLAAKFRSA
jgi:peroxiredoxin